MKQNLLRILFLSNFLALISLVSSTIVLATNETDQVSATIDSKCTVGTVAPQMQTFFLTKVDQVPIAVIKGPLNILAVNIIEKGDLEAMDFVYNTNQFDQGGIVLPESKDFSGLKNVPVIKNVDAKNSKMQKVTSVVLKKPLMIS